MDETATKLLQSKFPELVTRFPNAFLSATDFRGDFEVVVDRSQIRDCLQFLKGSLEFHLLMDLFGMDYLKQSESTHRFAVIYILYSLTKKRRIRLKVFLSAGEPTMTSVSDLFAAANWFEREAWDMYGIIFEGHPNLTRILCHQDFQGHPMRKDYPSDGYQRLKSPLSSSGI